MGSSLDAGSREVRRRLGPMSWAVLEDLALDAEAAEGGAMVARTSARHVAEHLDIQPGTAAKALGRHRAEGLVSLAREPGPAGRFGLSVYRLAAIPGLAITAGLGPGVNPPNMAAPPAALPSGDAPIVESPPVAVPPSVAARMATPLVATPHVDLQGWGWIQSGVVERSTAATTLTEDAVGVDEGPSAAGRSPHRNPAPPPGPEPQEVVRARTARRTETQPSLWDET